MKKLYFLLSVFLLIFSLNAQVIQSDRDALMALYNSTDGANWTNNTNWGTTELVSTWYGVTVSGDRVIIINLPGNQLSGSIPVEIGSLSSLTYLILSNNQLSGSIPTELGNLSALNSLELSNNQLLSGSIPAELGNLSSLNYLNLSDNQLSGSIPVEIGNLTSLTSLYLFSNEFSGSIPVELGNLTLLTAFYLDNNQLSGSIPAEIGNLSSLTFLHLFNNQLTGSIPVEIGSLTMLTVLNLYNNQLTGSIPSEIGDLVSLNYFNLGSNKLLNGSIPVEIGNLSSLTYLNLSDNQLTGSIPVEIGNLSSLTAIYLANNQLSGSIPTGLGNLNSLAYLDLANNQLSGSIPNEISNLSALTSLELSNNQLLSGSIPVGIGNLSSLNYLNLSDNQLSGSIPVEIGNLSSLTSLYLFNNQLTGSIPVEIGNLTMLTILNLYNNQLTGSIPAEIGNLSSLEFLDLPNNQLSGSIPNEIGNLSLLTTLQLQSNQLSGSIPVEIGNLTSLTSLYLFSNQLSGSIPSEFGNLSALTILQLYNNQLSGSIPIGIGNLINLTKLYLYKNQFDYLPDLSALTNLSDFYIEDNLFDFGDLERANITSSNYDYSRQGAIIATRNENAGQITFGFTVDGSNNQYQWYEKDTELSGETNNTLIVNSTDDGAYYCKITDSNFPDLILTTVAEELGNSGLTNGVLTSEYNALIAVYDNTDGDNWINNTNWKSSENVSEWYGVKISGVHVSYLSLRSNQLSGTIPPEIGNLSNLTTLSFTYNQLIGSIPAEIGNLTNLTYLSFYSNQLIGNIPPEIGNLTNLEQLWLTYNQLNGSIPSEIGNLTNLTGLYMAANQLSGSVPSEIGNLINLTSLDFDINQLSGSVPTELGNLTNLYQLFLGNNQFEELPDLSALTNLSYWEIYNNNFTFEDLEPNIGIGQPVYSPQAKVGTAVSENVNIGDSHTVSVTVGGTNNIYQWYHNNVLIDGATESSYNITSFVGTDAGDYTCQISNTVATDLKLESEPISLSYTGNNATFTITDGSNPIQNATINLTGYGSKQTDVSGTATFLMATSNDVSYFVSANGFNQASGSVTMLNADIVENVELSLTTYSVTITVTDGTNPIQASTVNLTGYGNKITDINGNAVFTSVLPENNISYTVSASNYDNIAGSINVINSDVTSSVELSLTTYAVTFSVTDGSNPIQNAIVELTGYGNQTTDVSGHAVFNNVLPENNISYTAIANGLQVVSGSISIVDSDIVENVILNIVVAPEILSVSINQAAQTNSEFITITGKNILNTATVTIGGMLLSNMTISDNIITGWTNPDLNVGAYDIMVSNLIGLNDVLTNGFTIIPKIEIISPNGSEIFSNEGSFNIVYQINKISSGSILYSTNNGFSWNLLHQFEDKDIGQHSYSWSNVPAINSNHCFIKIQDAYYNYISDQSDHVFSIIKSTYVPAEPTSLNLINENLNSVQVNWQDVSDNEDGFKVYRQISGQAWQHVSTTTTTNYTDNNIIPATTYYYKITSYNDKGDSDYSNTLAVAIGNKPKAPTDLELVVKSDTKIRVAWEDESNNETGFRIQRSNTGTSWATVRTVSRNIESFTDYNLSSGSKYYYRVVAYNSYGNSDPTDIESIETGELPNTLTNLKSSNITTSSVTLSWSLSSDTKDGLYIYRGTSIYNMSKIDRLSKRTYSYNDNANLISGRTYYYKIAAYNEIGEKATSAIPVTMGSKPGSINLNKSMKSASVVLNWNKATNCDGYYLRINAGSSYTQLDLSKNTLSYEFKLRTGVNYTFWIIAHNNFDKTTSNKVSAYLTDYSNVSFSATVRAMDNVYWTKGASVYVDRGNGFSETAEGITDENGRLYINNLKIGNEILITKKVHTEKAKKGHHQAVDKNMYEIWLDNGNINSSGEYTYLKIESKKDIYYSTIFHPVFQYNLVASIEWNLNSTQLEQYKSGFDSASNYLYQISDGTFLFKKVALYDKKENWTDADFRAEDIKKLQANAHGFGIYYDNSTFLKKDYRIRMGSTSLHGNDPPNKPNYFRTIVHEFGHYGFGFHDEYMDGNGNKWTWKTRPISNHGFMDDQKSIISMSSWNDYPEEFNDKSHLARVNPSNKTLHVFKRQLPCWRWIIDHLESQHVDINIKEPPYGYWNGNRIIGKGDRKGPGSVPMPYSINIIDKTNTSSYSNIKDDYEGCDFKPFSESYYYLNDSLNYLGLCESDGELDYPEDLTCSTLLFVKRENWNLINSQQDTVLNENTPGINFLTKINEISPVIDLDLLVSFDSEVSAVKYCRYFFPGNNGTISLSDIGSNKYTANLILDPYQPGFEGEGYFAIGYSYENDTNQVFVSKLSIDGLINNDVNYVNVDELELLVDEPSDNFININSTYCVPYNSYQQGLIPVSHVYNIDFDESDIMLADTFRMSIRYRGLNDSIDKTTIQLYKFMVNDNIWKLVDGGSHNMSINEFNIKLCEEGIYALFATAFCQDTIAPSEIDDLIALPAEDNSVLLSWTPTGDDEDEGKALYYEVRYNIDNISIGNWQGSDVTASKFVANGQDTIEFIVDNLRDTTYYFAIKAWDDNNNVSEISNVAISSPGIENQLNGFVLTLREGRDIKKSVVINKTFNATNGYDNNYDQYYTEVDAGYSFYSLLSNGEKLKIDTRQLIDSIIKWEIRVQYKNVSPDTLQVKWDITEFLNDGIYTINNISMHGNESIDIFSDTTIIVEFSPFEKVPMIPDMIVEEDFAPTSLDLSEYFSFIDTVNVTLDYFSDNVQIEYLQDTTIVINSIPNWNGKTECIATQIDILGNHYPQVFELNVIPVNDAPEFLSSPDLTEYVDSVYSYQLEFSDVDTNDSVYVSTTNLPDWLSLNTENMLITGTPTKDELGTHDVEITITDGEEFTSQTFTIDVQDATGIEELLANSLKIFPNPTEDKIFIESSMYLNEKIFIELVDQAGKTILSKVLDNLKSNQTYELDLSGLNYGVYYLKISNDKLIKIEKIVKN